MSEEAMPRGRLAEVLRRHLGPLGLRPIYLRSEIATFRRYLRTVTASFERDHKANDDDFQRLVESATSPEEAESIAHEVSNMGRLLRTKFPALAYQTTFVATYTLLEDELAGLARVLGQGLGVKLELDDLSRKGIHAARVYLEKLCGLSFPEGSHAWQEAVQYSHLRNVLVHARGRLKEGDKARKFAESKKLLPTYVCGRADDLQLTMDFCLEVADNVEALLNDLFRLADARLRASP
jgi:hypothetical protein